tara:strand:+ start:361 stop:765 length:405 start_codon:yes stop_codon:yes gene_type:complete
MSLIASVKFHEGLELKPYLDSSAVGILTIGYGRNLEDRGITKEEAEMLLLNDLAISTKEGKKFHFYSHLSSARQDVIVEMIFNLGLTRFKKFKKTIKAIENKDFSSAADEMLNSKWAGQVGQRAITLSNKFRAG